MNSLDNAMKNLRESKKMESEKLAKLVEKKTLKESLSTEKEIITEAGSHSNYGGLINASDDVLFTSIANTEVYERLQGIRDYLNDYAKILRGDRAGEYAEDDELINEAAYYVREALETLDKAWENL